MFRIVKGVNDVMRGAGMIRVLLVNFQRDRSGSCLQAITLVLTSHQSQQRQRIKRGSIEIVRDKRDRSSPSRPNKLRLELACRLRRKEA